MRRLNLLYLSLLVLGCAGCASQGRPAKVVKVLPHYLDAEGRAALAPSLYDRDAYQAQLRATPSQRSGLRFDVQWRAAQDGPLTLRVEMRGAISNRVTTAQLEGPLPPGGRFSRWSNLALTGERHQQFGDMTAWRVSVWQGTNVLAERNSFLW